VSATVLDEVEAHPGHQVEELGDYFRDTYAGASKLFMIPIYPLTYKMYQSQKVQEKEFMAKTNGRQFLFCKYFCRNLKMEILYLI
jgi:hypothetical protein